MLPWIVRTLKFIVLSLFISSTGVYALALRPRNILSCTVGFTIQNTYSSKTFAPKSWSKIGRRFVVSECLPYCLRIETKPIFYIVVMNCKSPVLHCIKLVDQLYSPWYASTISHRFIVLAVVEILFLFLFHALNGHLFFTAGSLLDISVIMTVLELPSITWFSIFVSTALRNKFRYRKITPNVSAINWARFS